MPRNKKPLLLKLKDKYYTVDINGIRELIKNVSTEFLRSADAVAGTVPLGLVMGVIVAEEMNKAFLFVRPKPKDHGTKRQVEGITEGVDYTFLLDPVYDGVENYGLDAMRALRELKMEVMNLQNPDISPYIKEVDVNGKKIVTVEDLISTGGSSMEENEGLLDLGAEVFPVSIFDYQLPEAFQNFAKRGLANESVVNFHELMEEYSKVISIDDAEELYNWHKTQPTWGYDNGFSGKNN